MQTHKQNFKLIHDIRLLQMI